VSEKVSEPYVPPPSRSKGIGASDNGLAAEDDTTRERIRRPGPWTAVPNYVLTERRLRPCSSTARHLFAVGWIYSNQQRTDGEIGATDLRSLAASMDISEARAQDAAEELVRAGLWAPGYRVIDFTVWNLDAEEISRRAEQSRQRAQRWRDDQKVSPAPLPKAEGNIRQHKATGTYEVRTTYGVSEPITTAETPEASKQRLETAQRLKELGERFRLPAVPVG
jgi:hypothetical protein